MKPVEYILIFMRVLIALGAVLSTILTIRIMKDQAREKPVLQPEEAAREVVYVWMQTIGMSLVYAVTATLTRRM